MFCNSCGKEYETSTTNYFCETCRDTKEWPIERKHCAMCGKTFGYRTIVVHRSGDAQNVSKREGYFFCKECRAKQGPKYNCSQADIDALVSPNKAPHSVVQKAYGKYYPARKHVVVVYECACETPTKVNHHYDYARPYEVVRLCNSCHRKEHARLNFLRQQNMTIEVIA